MKPIISISILFTLFFMNTSIASQPLTSYPLWNQIESGEYSVGYKVINHWDRSRNRFPKYDQSGELNQDRFFPLQISIWYPSVEPWDSARAMAFAELFYLTEQKNDFKLPSQERKKKALDIFFNFATFGADLSVTREQLAQIGSTATSALPDANAASGTFPVIIAGHDGGVWKGSTLSEYLASHGYVVISTGPLSQTFSMISENPQSAIQRRIRTFELVKEMTAKFEFIDNTKIGLLGLNADGMPAMLYQMKNREADALVSIDGWEGKNNGYKYVSSSPYYDTINFNIPYLEFQQHEETERESLQLNSSIFESLSSPSKRSYVLTDFGHAYLTGNLIAIPSLDQNTVEKYQFMYRSILTFYNYYLKTEKTLFKESEKPDSFFQRAEIIMKN